MSDDENRKALRELPSFQADQIRTLYEEIAEIKEKTEYLEDRYKESGGLKCLRDRGLIREVLRIDYIFKIKNLPDNPLRVHYKGLLEMLDSKTEKKDGCFNCKSFMDMDKCNDIDCESYKEFIYTTFKTGICNNYKKASGGEKEKSKGRVYFEQNNPLLSKTNDYGKTVEGKDYLINKGIDSKLPEVKDFYLGEKGFVVLNDKESEPEREEWKDKLSIWCAERKKRRGG